jgi:YHS domain-containing protein
MRISKSFAMAITLSAVALGGLVNDAMAIAEVNVAPGRTLKGPGIALHGYDPVAYFTVGKPVQGSAEYSVVHAGATYRFANAANLAAFRADPAKYIPAFGGYCAYGVSVGAKFDGDPRFWKIVDGKLYLNLNKQIQKTWLKDVPGNIKKARKAWPRIIHRDPAALG